MVGSFASLAYDRHDSTPTVDTYSHVVPALRAEVAKRMQSILGLPDGSELVASGLSVVDEDAPDDLHTDAI